ncbi:DUF6728 family protein [Sediminitomix flava]|uniref:Uncharacterized protein n=1 Tax=Sediminitomix flava TaxID=379075 RepID=A0A315ZGC9_SEDFL|nr:DUF6728 family protein [Sediminitomix flava]PWJ43918.1 hypothetical protein BC781_101268 [Sediminitomix flava]
MTTQEPKNSNRLKEYFSFGDVFRYIFGIFSKRKGEKPNLSLRMMHGVNKISILMFFIAVLVIIFRQLFLR